MKKNPRLEPQDKPASPGDSTMKNENPYNRDWEPFPCPPKEWWERFIKGLFFTIVLIMAVGCSARSQKPSPRHHVEVPSVFRGTIVIETKSCSYLSNGVDFTCKNPVFKPMVVDVRKK